MSRVGSKEHMVSVGWHPSVSWEERREAVRAMLEGPPMFSEATRLRLEAELAELDKGEAVVWPEGRK
jgi:hypothetical protein